MHNGMWGQVRRRPLGVRPEGWRNALQGGARQGGVARDCKWVAIGVEMGLALSG